MEDRAVNFLACVLFGISAIAGYIVPKTGDVLDLAAANVTTALGALCFLVGSLMLVTEAADPQRSDSGADGPRLVRSNG